MTLPDEGRQSGAVKPFLGHLRDLRSTILWCLAFLGLGMVVAFPLVPRIHTILTAPVGKVVDDPDSFLKVMQVTSGMSIAMRIIFWGGLLLSLPFIVVTIWKFIFPALKGNERKGVLGASAFAVVLFVAGVCMGYFWTLPVALRVMFRINRWLGVTCDFVELSDYIGFVLKLLIAFGVAFELPVVVLALGQMGIISGAQLRDKRPYVIVGIMIVAMFLTPPDPLTLLLMAMPMALLYECCIWIIWAKERRKRLNPESNG